MNSKFYISILIQIYRKYLISYSIFWKYVKISEFWQLEEILNCGTYEQSLVYFGYRKSGKPTNVVKNLGQNSLYLLTNENYTRNIMSQLPTSNFPMTEGMACINRHLGELEFWIPAVRCACHLQASHIFLNLLKCTDVIPARSKSGSQISIQWSQLII